MALVLTSETQMVRDTAHEFFKERAPITALRKLRDTNDPDGFSRGLWREMAELGWTGFLVPEDHGGRHSERDWASRLEAALAFLLAQSSTR